MERDSLGRFIAGHTAWNKWQTTPVICRVCNNELGDENWYPSLRCRNVRLCIECAKRKSAVRDKRFYIKHKVKIIQQKKEYQQRNRENILAYNRLHYLGTDGRFFSGLNKRTYPDNHQCELCDKPVNRLGYHHWDDGNMSVGIWLCSQCHVLAELTEKDITSERYLQLKHEIIDGVPNAISF